jgi:halocyanin-like protein
MERRAYLAAVVGAIGSIAGCEGGGSPEYGDWFSNVDNYDGEVDRTGEPEIEVAVGADDGFAFEPAAIRVDVGTTVVWQWTGRGGRHNVVERDGAFSSPFHRAANATFSHAFEDPGLFPYVCEPHRHLGMKGGVRVE